MTSIQLETQAVLLILRQYIAGWQSLAGDVWMRRSLLYLVSRSKKRNGYSAGPGAAAHAEKISFYRG